MPNLYSLPAMRDKKAGMFRINRFFPLEIVWKGAGVPKKRQRTTALQDAGAILRAQLRPQGFGVRLSSAALNSVRWLVHCSPHLINPPPNVGGYTKEVPNQ